VLNIYRILVGGMVMFGAVATFDLAWSLADVTMGLMVLCNLIAVSVRICTVTTGLSLSIAVPKS
jgi:alanine or glycine:cation symporter, AGCS family